MKLIIKIALCLLGVLVLGLVGFFVWVSYFLDLNTYKKTISRTIFENSGYIVDFKGDLSFSLYPSLGLTVAEMTVLDKDHADNILMDVKKIHFSLHTSSLLWHKQIKVTEILAKGVDMRIIYGATPREEAALIQKSAESETQALTPKAEGSIAAERSTNTLMQRLEKSEIERVLIENSNIFLIDAVTKKTYTLSSVRLETAHIKIGAPIDLFLSTEFTMANQAQMNVTLSTRLSLGPEFKTMQLDPFKLVLDQDIFEGHFNLDRRFLPWQIEAILRSDEFDFSHFLKDPKQKVLMKQIQTKTLLAFDPNSSELPKSLDGEVLFTAGALSFSGIDLVEKALMLDQLRRMFVNKKSDFPSLLTMGKKIVEPSTSHAKTTVMEKLTLKNVIQNAKIMSDLEITGTNGDYLIFGKGNIGFDQTIDFQLSLGLPEQQDKNLPTIVIPFKINGTVSDPDIRPIEKDLLKQIETIMKARLTDEVQDQIKDQAASFLKSKLR